MMLLLFAFACAPSAAPTTGLRFADASEAQRDAAFASAFGYGSFAAFMAQFDAQIDALDGAGSAPCPEAILEGDTLTLSADGCTGPITGTTWSGRAVATNAPGVADLFTELGETDPDAPYELVFEGWSGVAANGTSRFDGGFGMSDWGLGASWESEQDLRAELPGLPAFSTTTTQRCVRLDGGSTICEPEGPQSGWVDGLGALTVDAEGVGYGADGRFTGVFDIHGPTDSLHVDLETLDGACVPAVLDDGATVELCLPAPLQDTGAPPPEGYDAGPLLGVMGPNLDEDGLSAGAMTDTPVASVELSIDGELLGLGEETHPFGPGAWDEGLELTRYELLLPRGAYLPGVSTAFPDSADSTRLAVRLLALDADGSALGCLFALPTDTEGGTVGTPDDWFDNTACPLL